MSASMRWAVLEACMACSVGLKVGQPATAEHFWPLALGPRQNSSTNAVLPPSLNKALSWSWHHPGGRYHTTIAGGPVIDSDKNLYLQTNDGTRKFSPDGKTLWHYQPLGDTNNEPSLMGDYVFGNTNNGFAYALNRHTGWPLWIRKYAENAGGDVGYPGAHEGVYVMGVDAGTVKGHEGGNSRIIGIEAKTGDKLWEYHPEWPSWNFMPLFPGDGTLLFMDFTGGAYRLGLRNGTEIWHTAAPGTAKLSPSFGDGGMTVGANGIAYTCSNPGAMGGNEGTQGVLRAYRASDGKPFWERILPQPCNSWPAVGRLGSGPELSVVVTPGSFMGSRVMHGGIMAFNAESGRLLWKFQAPPYSHIGNMAMGDLEGYLERNKFDPRHAICLPAHWTSPHIAGNGDILAGRSDGILYRLRGPTAESDEDTSAMPVTFETSPGVELKETFNAQGAGLHGAIAAAPGMLAYSTCTDNLFVFKFE